MKRRDFCTSAVGATIFSSVSPAFASAGPTGVAQPGGLEKSKPVEQKSNRPDIAMLIYPGMTFLDLMGPYAVLARTTNVHLIWKDLNPIAVEPGLTVQPTCSFDDCPTAPDVLFVGGGPGVLAVMEDRGCRKFLADRGASARYVTSVCTGSLILGAAGLLHGFRATSHWAYRDLLPLFGAIPVEQRVVVDRNRITGGGVTAGIDFGLTLLSILLGEGVAKATELAIEYDPHPPFDTGTPEKAGEETTQAVLARIGPRIEKIREYALQTSGR